MIRTSSVHFSRALQRRAASNIPRPGAASVSHAISLRGFTHTGGCGCCCSSCATAVPGAPQSQRFFSSDAAAKLAETKTGAPEYNHKYLRESAPIDPNDALRKGLSWRAKQRGWLELDWLVGTFAQKHLATLSEEECALFEEILEVDNPDLFQWLSSQKPAPKEMLENTVYMMMAEYVNAEHPDIMRRMSTQNQNLK
eukprot:CAMPEP_0178994230 /NCGR_PEP_ID=MMETSP0795-20121207/7155_1 /TAXON_ID=88552 /ORGANISM="Amoebophrya sp., Strain Ameob2" /LENGTH=196 /DNA_ID=CAMNT_0020686401 /DNA_START=157 /DNA_END=747 /DNA_ORIENTATION=-